MSRRARALAHRSYPWTGLDPDRRNAILLIGGIALVVVFALGLIAYGYYTDRVAPKHGTVIRVGDRKFDYAYLERRAKADFRKGRFDPSNLSQSLLDLMTLIQREEVTRQAARTIGITATDEEIEARYRVKLGVAPNASREQLASELRTELVRLGLSLDEYRETAAADVLRRKLRAHFAELAPAEAEYVDLRIIHTDTQTAALQAKQRLDAGELFSRVAIDVSTDPSGQQQGGGLSWVPRPSLARAVGDAAFAIPLGTVSDVIETREDFVIILVSDRETRPVGPNDKDAIASRQLQEFLLDHQDKVGFAVTLTVAQLQRLIAAVRPDLG